MQFKIVNPYITQSSLIVMLKRKTTVNINNILLNSK